jgi:hypothetical protein
LWCHQSDHHPQKRKKKNRKKEPNSPTSPTMKVLKKRRKRGSFHIIGYLIELIIKV